MKMSDLLPSIVPSWVKWAGYALVALAVIGPYVALYHYVPKYKAAKLEIIDLKGQVIKLAERTDALEQVRIKCNEATERMKKERDAADIKRRAAEAVAKEKADGHDTRIIGLKVKLKEPTDVKQECKQIKDLIDDYTIGPVTPVRMRDNAPSGAGNGGSADPSQMRR